MMMQRQKGFSLVSAIFVIVIMAALAVYMLSLSSTQTQSVALNIQSSRVYHAARSGIEWGLNNVLNEVANPSGNCFADNTFNLGEFTVTVSCNTGALSEHPENGVNQRIYRIESVARFGTLGQPSYVQRRIEVSANRVVP